MNQGVIGEAVSVITSLPKAGSVLRWAGELQVHIEQRGVWKYAECRFVTQVRNFPEQWRIRVGWGGGTPF